MKKKKIAESIIIRVGGGIREIRREPIDNSDLLETADTGADYKQPEEVHSFRSESGSTSMKGKDKTIN